MDATTEKVDFADRDGAAEADRDLAVGKGLTLYYRAFDGFVPTFQIPGLRGSISGSPKAASDTLVRLSEADFREGRKLTDEQAKLRESAFLFAKAYNQTMFRATAEEIHRLFPLVTIRD